MNLVANPDFFDLEESWQLTNLSGAQALGKVMEGEYQLSIQNGGSNASDVHLGQSGLPLEQNTEYQFSFDAYADHPIEITPIVAKNGPPWTVYHEIEPIAISTDRQNHSFTFNMAAASDPDARLGFDAGGQVAIIYLDDVLLRKSDETSSNVDIQNFNKSNWSVLPNPVKQEANIQVTMDAPNLVSLEIFDLSGRLEQVILNDYLQAGTHQFFWNPNNSTSGIYLCRIQVGNQRDARKLIVTN